VVDDGAGAQALGSDAGRQVLDVVISQPDRHLLVAEGEGGVVGTVDQLIVANLTHQGRPWCIVENMVVDEGHRRGGVGQALMEEVLLRARGAGCYKVQLLSRRVRTDAHDFYRALGFEDSAQGFRLYL
jgi:GNAT superfamily N-acetyltransferase